MRFIINSDMTIQRKGRTEREKELKLDDLKEYQEKLKQYSVKSIIIMESDRFLFKITPQKVVLTIEEDCNDFLNLLDEKYNALYSIKRIPQGEGLGLVYDITTGEYHHKLAEQLL